MDLGRFKLHVLSDGDFHLDGGAMFGVVPKVMWETAKPADKLNRIRMCSNSLLVETGDELVLVDTGLGDMLSDKLRHIYGMEEGVPRLPDRLAEAGFSPADVTQVIVSHLHFDHCGWNTRVVDGEVVPTFPNARYWINRYEVEHARARNQRDASSYLPENWEPLFEAGQADMFDDEIEPVAGIRSVRASGHSPGMCIVLVDGGGGQKAVFLADLVPTSAHVPFAWLMAYDLEPIKSMAEKRRWIPQIADGDWVCVFEHDPVHPMGTIVEESPGRYRACELGAN